MRTTALVSIVLLALVVLLASLSPIEAQSNEVERLKQELAMCKALINVKEAARQDEIRKRMELEGMTRSLAERLKEAKRVNERQGRLLRGLKAEMSALMAGLGEADADSAAAQGAKIEAARQAVARSKRQLHHALTLMQDLLKRKTIDVAARTEIVRTAGVMGSAAARLAPVIESLPESKDERFETARKWALEKIAPPKKM